MILHWIQLKHEFKVLSESSVEMLHSFKVMPGRFNTDVCCIYSIDADNPMLKGFLHSSFQSMCPHTHTSTGIFLSPLTHTHTVTDPCLSTSLYKQTWTPKNSSTIPTRQSCPWVKPTESLSRWDFKRWKQKASFRVSLAKALGLCVISYVHGFHRNGYAAVSYGNSDGNPGKEHDNVFSSYLWEETV